MLDAIRWMTFFQANLIKYSTRLGAFRGMRCAGPRDGHLPMDWGQRWEGVDKYLRSPRSENAFNLTPVVFSKPHICKVFQSVVFECPFPLPRMKTICSRETEKRVREARNRACLRCWVRRRKGHVTYVDCKSQLFVFKSRKMISFFKKRPPIKLPVWVDKLKK